MIKGTCVEKVSEVLLRLSRRHRFQVREITLDMASKHVEDSPALFSGRQTGDRPFPCPKVSI